MENTTNVPVSATEQAFIEQLLEDRRPAMQQMTLTHNPDDLANA